MSNVLLGADGNPVGPSKLASGWAVEPIRWGILVAVLGDDVFAWIAKHEKTIMDEMSMRNNADALFPTVHHIKPKPSELPFQFVWAYWLNKNEQSNTLTKQGAVAPGNNYRAVHLKPVLADLLDFTQSRSLPKMELRRNRIDRPEAPHILNFASRSWDVAVPPKASALPKNKRIRAGMQDLGWFVDMSPERNGIKHICEHCAYCVNGERLTGDPAESGEDYCLAFYDGLIPATFITATLNATTWQMCWTKRLCPYYTKAGNNCAEIYRRWELAPR